VLLDASAARPPLTGVGWSMVEMVRALAAAAPADYRFTLLTGAPEHFAAAHDSPAVTVRALPAAGGRLRRVLSGRAAASRAAKELDADLVHALTMPGPLRSPIPTVVTVHDLAYRHVPGTIEGPRRLWYRLAVPRGLRRAARILANSEATACEVRAAFPDVAARVRVTPFGTPSWTARAAADRGPPPQDAAFLFVGALEPRKNLDRILTALELLRAEAPPGERPVLRVVGAPGWRNRKLLARLRRLSREGAVLLEGHQPHRELQRRLVSARALLLPSLHEGFGFPILEGMALGTPVITSDRGAMRETAGDAALLVDPEDPRAIAAAMARILTEPDLVQDLVARGRTRAAARCWAETAAATLAAYAEILD